MVEPTRPEAMVEFGYSAQEPDELTISKGDIITDIKIQPGGWWEGTLGDKRGMFPDNFVRLLTHTSKQTELPSDVPVQSVSGRRCKVLFSYQPVHEDELQLEVNDIIDIIGEVEEGWWKGKLRDTIGVFPSNFVTEINDNSAEPSSVQPSASNHKSRSSRVSSERENDTSSNSCQTELTKSVAECDAPVLPPKPVKELCRVLYPYTAANDDELTLKEGDTILLLSKEVADKGWWKGELRGQVGVFPDNFVEVIQQEEASKKPERPPSKSQLCTTNRMRDTITKPSVTATSKNENVDTSGTKKPSEICSKQDEKTSSFPPIPGKKPQLPLPIKKPQRNVAGVSQGAKHQDSVESSLPDVVDGVGVSRLVPTNYSVPKSNKGEVPEFDNIERSAMLVHPTASRVKAPRRRLPTTVHNRDVDNSPGVMNGSVLSNSHENDFVKNSTQGRIWESKSKAPWMEELKMNQAKKNVSGPTKSPSGNESSVRPIQNIETVSPTTPDISAKPPTLGLFQYHGNERQQVSQGIEVSSNLPSNNKRHSLNATLGVAVDHSPVSEVNQTVQNLKSIVKQQPPNATSNTPAASDVPEKNDNNQTSVSSSTTTVHGPLSSNTHYLEVRIKKLERCIEEQREMFTQAIKEITEKLTEERNRRTHIEQELDKLTNLVTQV